MIILMSLITDFINVSKISYWCLYTTVIMNIVLTSFWCNIPILECMSTLWTSKCDHFDVTHNCDCQRHLSIIMMSLSICDYIHHFNIILMLHTKTRYISVLKTSKCDHFDVTSHTVTKTSFCSTVHINVTKTSKLYHYRIVIVKSLTFDSIHHLYIILM